MAEIQELLLEGALGPLAFRPMVTLTQLSKERAGLKAFYCPDPKDKNWAIELNGNNEMFDFIISTSMRFMFFRFPKGNQINLIEL